MLYLVWQRLRVGEILMWLGENLAAELELEMEKNGLVRIYGSDK